MNRGWVYIISNPSMPGIIKVGYSTNHPRARAKELKTTGIPTAYKVIFSVVVDNPYELEQKVHNHLRKYRKGGEWFTCSSAVAAAAIKELYSGAYHNDVDYKNINPAELALENEKYKKIAESKAAEERVAAAFVEKNNAARLAASKIEAKYRDTLDASRSPILDIFFANDKRDEIITKMWQEKENAAAQIYGTIYYVCNSYKCGYKGIHKPTWLDATRGAINTFRCPQCNSHIHKISFTGWDVPPFFSNGSSFHYSTFPFSQ